MISIHNGFLTHYILFHLWKDYTFIFKNPQSGLKYRYWDCYFGLDFNSEWWKLLRLYLPQLFCQFHRAKIFFQWLNNIQMLVILKPVFSQFSVWKCHHNRIQYHYKDNCKILTAMNIISLPVKAQSKRNCILIFLPCSYCKVLYNFNVNFHLAFFPWHHMERQQWQTIRL